jgi:Rps23 Pro-64 3,4-dihydroxylase Tpa1-like proline 4-hydroxylase
MHTQSIATRQIYTDRIVLRLEAEFHRLQTEFHTSGRIPTCHLDDLLAPDAVRAIYAAYPAKERLIALNDLREHKYVGIQLDRYPAIFAEIIYAFQDPKIVNLIAQITGIANLVADPHLYAAGFSLMEQGHFLNPHLDNSHDKDRQNYRALNLLFYVTPDWQPHYGGNLELWDNGLDRPCRSIPAQFNRLVIMATDRTSWHSVSPIVHPGRRCCISNYYFSPDSPNATDYSHVTSFRGRPDQPWRDRLLRADSRLRNGIRRIRKQGIKRSHYYRQ